MEIQTIKAGYKKEVAVPSDVFQDQSSGDRNFLAERIILPPKLFKQQGKSKESKGTDVFVCYEPNFRQLGLISMIALFQASRM